MTNTYKENVLLHFILKAGLILEMVLLPAYNEGDIFVLQDLIFDYFNLRFVYRCCVQT